MLRVRVISAIVGLILLGVFVLSNQIVLGVGVFLLAIAGMYEFYNAVSNAGYRPIRTIGYISCVPILFMGLNGVTKKIDNYFDLFKSINYFSFGIFVVVLVLFAFIVFLHDKYNINDIALTIFGAAYVAFLFSFIVLTRNLENGFFYIWLIFIGAFVTDTSAYFAGRMFGRHKILPEISPKKTVEGCLGGIVGCIAITVLYGVILDRYVGDKLNISLYHFVIIGVLNGVISQIGDWAASAIKRYVKIKDYGKIMPGHGGVLDRFDSILFIAPVVYFYISFIILG